METDKFRNFCKDFDSEHNFFTNIEKIADANFNIHTKLQGFIAFAENKISHEDQVLRSTKIKIDNGEKLIDIMKSDEKNFQIYINHFQPLNEYYKLIQSITSTPPATTKKLSNDPEVTPKGRPTTKSTFRFHPFSPTPNPIIIKRKNDNTIQDVAQVQKNKKTRFENSSGSETEDDSNPRPKLPLLGLTKCQSYNCRNRVRFPTSTCPACVKLEQEPTSPISPTGWTCRYASCDNKVPKDGLACTKCLGEIQAAIANQQKVDK